MSDWVHLYCYEESLGYHLFGSPLMEGHRIHFGIADIKEATVLKVEHVRATDGCFYPIVDLDIRVNTGVDYKEVLQKVNKLSFLPENPRRGPYRWEKPRNGQESEED